MLKVVKVVKAAAILAAMLAPASAFAQAVPQSTSKSAPNVPSSIGLRPIITRLHALPGSSFELSWRMDELAEGGPQVLGWRIYRNGQVLATVDAAAREYKDQNLTPATVYSYSVAAVVRQGEAESELASPALSDISRLPNEGSKRTRSSFDVVVAGATPGGIAAALAVSRLGHTVALVSPSPWLGGMMTGGLSRTDFGSMKSAGGVFKEFVDRVNAYYIAAYGASSAQVKASRGGYYFEPRVAKWVFHQMLAEQTRITVLLDHHSTEVVKQDGRVSELYVLDRPRMIRKILSAKIFIDATYEGDLAAQAGARFRMGRESREEFGEEHAGEMFWEPVSRTIQMGSGAADRRVQAYNFRLCLSRDPDNRRPFPLPTAYDRERYVSLLPTIASGRVKNMEQVMSILPLPNDKWDANNHPLGNPSTDLIGGADAYPESDLWARESIAQAHLQHILGLLYFVQNDDAVPASFRQEASRWGLAADEFVDNGGWPTQLYVREGRRIMGAQIFTENDARSGDPEVRPNFHPNSVGVADYPIDSHATHWEQNGLLEGFFYLAGAQTQPSQIPFGVMTPPGAEGVIVSVCVSSTHIGYGTLRMEPVFLSLGTAAGVAAHLCLQENVLPSRLPTADLQRSLLAWKQVICVFHDVPLEHPNWAALQFFGARGFFPKYLARPDEPATQGEAASWLWRWMQELRPELRDSKSTDAVESLRSLKILSADQLVQADEPLPFPLALDWIEEALRLLNRRPYAPRLTPLQSEGAPAISRSELCQKLYQAQVVAPGE